MTGISPHSFARHCRRLLGGACLGLLGACSALSPTTSPPPTFYALDNTPGATQLVPPVAGGLSAPTLIIHPARAAAGFDSQRIIYLRQAHQIEYFAHSEWVDAPARMLGPLLVQAMENSGAFRAVVLASSAAAGDLRLDTEIIRLQHEFQTQPSRARFTLRAALVDDRTRRVLAWREFDTTAAAATEDPYGGVLAANRAVQAALQELAVFCADAVRKLAQPTLFGEKKP